MDCTKRSRLTDVGIDDKELMPNDEHQSLQALEYMLKMIERYEDTMVAAQEALDETRCE